MMYSNVSIVWFCTSSEHLTLLNDIFLTPVWQGKQNETILVVAQFVLCQKMGRVSSPAGISAVCKCFIILIQCNILSKFKE